MEPALAFTALGYVVLGLLNVIAIIMGFCTLVGLLTVCVKRLGPK